MMLKIYRNATTGPKGKIVRLSSTSYLFQLWVGLATLSNSKCKTKFGAEV